MLKDFIEIDFDNEFENYTEYNWQTLSKKYKDMLLMYDELEKSVNDNNNGNQPKIIDIEREFKQISSYKKPELQEKYKLILIGLQKYKEYIEATKIANERVTSILKEVRETSETGKDISSSEETSTEEIIKMNSETNGAGKNKGSDTKSEQKKILIEPKQLKHIRDSLKRKNNIIEDLLHEVKTYKKEIESVKKESDKKIEDLQLRQENLMSLLDVKLSSDSSAINEVDLEKLTEIDKVRENNNALKEENKTLKKELQKINQQIKKTNIDEKLSSKENLEKLEILKELSKILKSSKFDNDLVKRLQKQIQLNKNLVNRVTEYEKLEKQVENSSSDYKKDYISFLRQILPNIELFRNALPKPEQELNQQAKIWVKGFEMVYRKLWEEVKLTNIEVINPTIGESFDSNFQEVIEQVDKEGFSRDEIVTVESYGFKYDGILLMPAKVKIQK